MNTVKQGIAAFILTTSSLGFFTLSTTPAQAVCLGQCKDAKNFCSNYHKSNPGEVCGTARGYVCRSKDWAKIKQVNSSWIACRYKGNDAHIAAARSRCSEFEDVWGGDCQVQSPHCKAGWVKLGEWGKISACRKIDLSGGVLYSGYRAYMRKFEGKASHKLPVHIHPFLKKHYDFDPDQIRVGLVDKVMGATCITDCFNIYCDDKTTIDNMISGFDMQELPLHELQHSHQCKRQGSRKAYALYWFKQVPGSFFKSLAPSKVGDFSDAFHDGMPMEKDAAKKGTAARASYVSEWWHKAARCRVYKSDKKTIISELDGKAYPRYFCDPAYGQPGAAELEKAARDLAKDLGGGQYHFGFGRPDEDDGVWLGKIDIENKIVETAVGVSFKGQTCPKEPTVRAVFATNGVRRIKFRINRDGEYSSWQTLEAKKVSGGYLAAHDMSLPVMLGPEHPHRFRLEVEGEEPTPWQTFKVDCPLLEVLKSTYKFFVEDGQFCPRQVGTRAVFETNGPGPVRYRREREGGAPSDWIAIQSKRDGNAYKAVVESSQKAGEMDQKRRVVAKRYRLRPELVASNWERFKVKCLDINASAIIFGGSSNGRCPFETDVRLRVNADMAGSAPYRLDCSDGQSRSGTFDIRKTDAQSFIGVAQQELNVRKTGKQICALKVDLGAGFKTITAQGHDFECATRVNPPSTGGGGLTLEPKPPGGRQPVALQCTNGNVEQGRCVCREGWNVNRAGPRHFVCKKQAANLRCIGGTARGNRCICPKGAIAKKIRGNVVRCGCPKGTKLLRGVCARPAG